MTYGVLSHFNKNSRSRRFLIGVQILKATVETTT
jgi:hypothetical protein